MDDLKHQVMVNQFVLAAGCLSHEAREHLKSTHWQFEAALSRYFQESGIPHQHNQHPVSPPTNTPAT
uniref:UBA-like domain-containing protein n=1 Tax=Ciona savignyi TaxID=51511 RepID=H2ZIW3_CIOSA